MCIRDNTHFDLANNYGPEPGSAEKNFGRILKEDLAPYRDELLISTKAVSYTHLDVYKRQALDGTVFYPEGGGQPADRGTLTLADGTVLHLVEAPLPVDGAGDGGTGLCGLEMCIRDRMDTSASAAQRWQSVHSSSFVQNSVS